MATKKPVVIKPIKQAKTVVPEILDTSPKALAKREVVELQSSMTNAASWLTVPTLEGETHYVEATSVLAFCREFTDKVDKKRHSFVDPLNKVVRELNAEFKKASEPVVVIESHVKGLLGTYLEAQRKAAQALAEKAAKKAEKRGQEQYAEDLRQAALAKPLATVAEGTGASAKLVWHARVTDLDAFLSGLANHENASSEPADLRAKLIAVIEQSFNKLAGALAKTDLGIKGLEGVSEFSFTRKRGDY
jgi:hypothetical protein